MGRFPVFAVRIGLVTSRIGRRIAVQNGVVFWQTVRFSIVLGKPLIRPSVRPAVSYVFFGGAVGNIF